LEKEFKTKLTHISDANVEIPPLSSMTWSISFCIKYNSFQLKRNHRYRLALA